MDAKKPLIKFWKKKTTRKAPYLNPYNPDMGRRRESGAETSADTLKVNMLNDNKRPWWKFWKKKQEKIKNSKKQKDKTE